MADPGHSHARKLVTTAQARVTIQLTFLPAIAIMLLLFASAGLGMWLLILVLQLALWTGWWLRWGRNWHPISELRWEREEARRGRPSTHSLHLSYARAWQQVGGEPGEELHAPPTARPGESGARLR